MELEELKKMWTVYDEKLDKNLRLNVQLLRSINFDKAKSSLSKLLLIKLWEVFFLMTCITWLSGFGWQNIGSLQFSAPALIIDMLLITAFIAAIRQIILIVSLQAKYNDNAVAPLQKKLETLKTYIVSYLKYSLFLIPLYPLMLIILAKIFLNVDLSALHHRAYLLSNVIVALTLLPISIWLFRELNKKVIEKKWVKQLLSGSGWYQAQAAQEFLLQIEKFEHE